LNDESLGEFNSEYSSDLADRADLT